MQRPDCIADGHVESTRGAVAFWDGPRGDGDERENDYGEAVWGFDCARCTMSTDIGIAATTNTADATTTTTTTTTTTNAAATTNATSADATTSVATAADAATADAADADAAPGSNTNNTNADDFKSWLTDGSDDATECTDHAARCCPAAPGWRKIVSCVNGGGRRSNCSSACSPKRGGRGAVLTTVLERQNYACTPSLPRWVSRGRKAKFSRGATCGADNAGELHLKVAAANVNTLTPQEVRAAQAQGLGMLVSGKALRLDKEFVSAGLDLVGIQESRIQANTLAYRAHYHVIGSAATAAGTHGIQLWVARRLRATALETRPIDHRSLFVVLQIAGRIIIVGVLHAPCNLDSDGANFYAGVDAIIREMKSSFPEAYILLLGDFNARVGSVQSASVGPHGAELENDNGTSLRLFAGEHSLILVNTFFANGSGHTWCGSRGHLARLDYILWRTQDSAYVHDCWVNDDIELAESERDDHRLAQADLQLPATATPTHAQTEQRGASGRRKLRLDRDKLRDASCKSDFAAWVHSFTVDDGTPIVDHLQALQDHITIGTKVFEVTESKPRRCWISRSAWSLMAVRGQTKKVLRSHLANFRLSLCRIIFLEWAACKPQTFLKYHHYTHVFLAQSMSSEASKRWAYHSFERDRAAAAKAVRQDKQYHLETLVAKADKAAERGDIKQVYTIAKHAAGTASQEVKVVAWEDGSLTTSDSEYYRRFQDHFQGVFGAAVVPSLSELGISQPTQPHETGRQYGPSVTRVVRAIASLPKGKALGPDDVASEVLQAAPTECAMQLQRILDKVWSYCYWPLAWRGGRLRELFKKGGRKNCENFRGLLISDHAGKAAASILYDGVDRPYHKYVAESQCGAVEGKGSDFATHLLRSLLDLAAINGLSIAILFVDLVKAFDRILREIVLG